MSVVSTPIVRQRTKQNAATVTDTFNAFNTVGYDHQNVSRERRLVDLGQLTTTRFRLKAAGQIFIGDSSISAFPGTVSTLIQASGSGSPTTTTILNSEKNFGLTGLAVSSTDVLEIEFNLTVNPVPGNKHSGVSISAAASIGADEYYTSGGGAHTGAHTNMMVWGFYPEIDKTSASRTNFEPIPGQDAFTTPVTLGGSTYYGARLDNQAGLCTIPATLVYYENVFNDATNTSVVANVSSKDRSPRNIHRMCTVTGTAMTLYAIRLAGLGVLHPTQDGTNSYFVVDKGAALVGGCSLNYYRGSLSYRLLSRE